MSRLGRPMMSQDGWSAALLLGPRTRAVMSCVQAMQSVGAASFCWYTKAWYFAPGADRDAWRRTLTVVYGILSPAPLPQPWVDWYRQQQRDSEPGHLVRGTADGYVLKLPAASRSLNALVRLAEECGDASHVEWTATGCEWLARRTQVHRRLRATLQGHGFMVQSPALERWCRQLTR